MGELVQLHIADVHLEGEIPHISINEDPSDRPGERKHIKTDAAVRKIPLHPDIMALGFEDFIRSAKCRRSKIGNRLFPQFPFGSDGQASTVASKWFARLMDRVGLMDPSLVFHSFRHNAEDAFRDALQPQYVIDRIIGHSDSAASAGYGNGISLEVAYDAVKAMRLKVSVLELLRPL